MRKAVALLALEAKQYAVAAEFFDLAIAERPKQAADLLQIWGLGLLIDDRAAEAAKVFQRGIDLKPAAGRRGGPLLLPGRRLGDERPHGRGPGRRPQGRRDARRLAAVLQPRALDPGTCQAV